MHGHFAIFSVNYHYKSAYLSVSFSQIKINNRVRSRNTIR
ncbi:hypothetical protein BC781_101828 [Sediminitomix flava]|uniref:Uncharacterized protein n=1 Tax=Sediminitomix flava TaxID=379075 RepID=A0A316A3Z6_SEDFL|nr:hypothetical protein BC781_101828 [Sediminitomix flava]